MTRFIRKTLVAGVALVGLGGTQVRAQHYTAGLMAQQAQRQQLAELQQIRAQQQSNAQVQQWQDVALQQGYAAAAGIPAQLNQIELQNKLLRWKIENPYGEAYLYGNGKVWLEPDHYLYYDHP
jgi:hypothetical protein